MRRRLSFLLLAALGAAALFTVQSPSLGKGTDGLVVHEWGTFTTLQDDDGRELSGINIDDEPVPKFVHDVNPALLASPVLTSTHWEYRMKGAPRAHPLVTMRLETPVIYFYPPKGVTEPFPVDVHVKFRGGWLTQFYPHAVFSAPQLETGSFDFGKLTPATVGSLTWNDLRVGTKVAGPKTDERVWLAPRKVGAAHVTNTDGESEKYLFYRGVGNLKAPLRIAMDRTNHNLSVFGNFAAVLLGKETAQVPPLWITQVRQDGSMAFRRIDGFTVSGDQKKILGNGSCRFAAADFSRDNRPKLEAEMHDALVEDGLFADEATALLSTWQWSYFESPGLRVFYLVPRQWTDFYLPLAISGNPQTERVMVGRIELVSDEQRELLGKLRTSKTSDGTWVELVPSSPARDRFLAGRSDFGDLGQSIPADYQLYLKMGRFRNALVTAEEARQPSPSLTKFINTYGLQPFRVPAKNSPEAALPVGKWKVEFANGVTEVCSIGNGGEASVEEPQRKSDGTAEVQGGSVVVTFQDDRVERWTKVGKRCVVEHWFPSSGYPAAAPVLGFAESAQ
jgi:hypothetical protein